MWTACPLYHCRIQMGRWLTCWVSTLCRPPSWTILCIAVWRPRIPSITYTPPPPCWTWWETLSSSPSRSVSECVCAWVGAATNDYSHNQLCVQWIKLKLANLLLYPKRSQIKSCPMLSSKQCAINESECSDYLWRLWYTLCKKVLKSKHYI